MVGSHCAKALRRAGNMRVSFSTITYLVIGEFVRWGPLIEGDVRDGRRPRCSILSVSV
jgi:hypothetical protein